MFVVIYNKSDKKIVQYRHDTSVPQVGTAQDYFDLFLVDNEVGDENYTFAEISFTKSLNDMVIGNHVYNEATGEVEADPSYVAPVYAPAPRVWTAGDIRAGLTLPERVKWDNNSAPEIVTVKSELSTPQKLTATTELLQLLVDVAVISQASMDKVLA